MATYKLHPALSRYHQRYNVSAATEAERVQMLRGYEAGQIVLLENCGFQWDFDLFERVDITRHADKLVNYLIAKLSMTDYFDVLWGDESPFTLMEKPVARRAHRDPEREAGFQAAKKHLRATAFASLDLRVRLAKQMQSYEQVVLEFYRRLFPEYPYSEYSINWRLTESRGESLHVDAYQTDSDFHQVKLFVNLDSAPRIWNTGEQMKTLVSRHYQALGLSAHLGSEYHRFLEECDKALFDLQTGPLDCQRTHTSFFDRGDVWIAETRQIPHQIFFGRKMVSVQFYIPPDKRIAPEISMQAFVEGLRQVDPAEQ
jgi:hypothetical protein